eukprot:sb/3477266/
MYTQSNMTNNTNSGSWVTPLLGQLCFPAVPQSTQLRKDIFYPAYLVLESLNHQDIKQELGNSTTWQREGQIRYGKIRGRVGEKEISLSRYAVQDTISHFYVPFTVTYET